MRPQERRARLDGARLYLVSGGLGGGPGLDRFLDEVLSAGVDILQLREKEMEAQPLLAFAEQFRAACDRHHALFIVNDRVDVALATEADGVHLGQRDLSPEFARAVLGSEAIIGRSTHAPEEIRRAHAEPVDYVAVGPVHETPTKPGRAAVGLDLVRLAAAEATLPWFAIGGIDAATVTGVVAAGARRIAVVRAIGFAPDPAAAAREMRSALGA
ncbi:MAG: thiamine phosphate synthase [Acidobacteria bacterium]|nr:thiamine phosphate synthase [Acidobacteriota bacterium]